MFEGFRDVDVPVGETTIRATVGGEGPPLLLLHGYPETRHMWGSIAPALARHHTVVAADLRGYGDSGRPEPDAAHAAYSKRAMAADQAQLMSELGHERFALAGHDRGARVAHRLCLDHAERVERVAVLDIVPTLHMFETTDQVSATTYFHWFFLAQAPDLPERMIAHDPDDWLRTCLERWSAPGTRFDPEAVEQYLRWFRAPGAIAASCEDYRAGASIDLEHDRASRDADARITAPLLALYGARGFVGSHYDVEAVWRSYAGDVTVHGADSGHFVPEEAPDETVEQLLAHLAGAGR